MKNTTSPIFGWLITGLVGAALMLAGGCSRDSKGPQNITPTQPMALQTTGVPAERQPVFDSDAEVVNALLAAVKEENHAEVHRLLGPAWKELVSGDPVEDAGDFHDFATRAAEKMRIEKKDDSTSLLHVGNDDWLFPIPVVKDSGGKWFLDTEAGKTEVLARRIGQNELEAIQICRLYVRAQHEYASLDPEATGEVKYAERILSTPGHRDGLFWNSPGGQGESPLAQLVEQEKLKGYRPAPGKHEPYHGYHFRVLKRQGDNVAGGKMNYVVDGRMTAGFALVAWPAEYESSGIMTFVVNQEGRVYQKDLGPDSTNIARKMQEYNPDNTWAVVTAQ